MIYNLQAHLNPRWHLVIDQDACAVFWKRFYHNFRPITHTADYPHQLIIAYSEKKSQQITRTGG